MIKLTALSFLALLGLCSAATVDAAATPLIDTGYSQEAVVQCQNDQCLLYFPATTAPVTEVTNVSCASTTVTKGFQIELAALHSPGGTAALQSFVFGSSPDGAVFTFGLVATTKLFYSAGSIPLLEVDPFVYGTSLGLDCTISGYTHS